MISRKEKTIRGRLTLSACPTWGRGIRRKELSTAHRVGYLGKQSGRWGTPWDGECAEKKPKERKKRGEEKKKEEMGISGRKGELRIQAPPSQKLWK